MRYLKSTSFGLLISTLALMISSSALAEEITVFFDNGSVPFMSGDGVESHGIYPSLVRVICADSGLQLKPSGLPWKRALDHSKDGVGWVGGIVKTSEREKIYSFTLPIHTEEVVAFTLKSNALSRKIKSFSDLAGLKVGSNRGWSHGNEWDALTARKAFALEESENAKTNMKRLVDGRIDVYVSVREDGLYAAKELKIADKVTASQRPLTQNTAHLAISKGKTPGATREKLNASIKKLSASGALRESVKREL